MIANSFHPRCYDNFPHSLSVPHLSWPFIFYCILFLVNCWSELDLLSHSTRALLTSFGVLATCEQCSCLLSKIALTSTFCEQEGNETEIELVGASQGGPGVLPEPMSPRGSGPPGLKGLNLLLAHHEETEKFFEPLSKIFL